MSTVGNPHAADINALFNHGIHLGQHILRIKSYTVADNAQSSFEENAGRHETELIFLIINGNSVTGIAAAAVADNGLCLLCKIIYNLALALVTPLSTQYCYY